MHKLDLCVRPYMCKYMIYNAIVITRHVITLPITRENHLWQSLGFFFLTITLNYS